jgi:Ca2+-binding RTX toxin-like protein
MFFALLFLGLLPIMFFGEVFPETHADDDDADAPDSSVDAGNIEVNGDFLDTIAADGEAGGAGGTQFGLTVPVDPVGPVGPVTEDETPVDPGEDPDDVLAPVTDDEPPADPDPVEPYDVLAPIQEPADEFAVEGDGTFLQQMLNSESDSDAGVGFLGTRIHLTDDIHLTGQDDVYAEADDGVPGNGGGTFATWDGTPLIDSATGITVIDGGAGNDDITAGDGAAYVFGGDGDDTLTAGDGVSALFGGSGADVLTGSDSATVWLDGGDGDDVLQGGAAGEVLHGGAHRAGDEATQDDDRIDGGGGDDIIRGGFGADTLSGGDGDDIINHLGRAEEDISWERHDYGWHIDNDADTLDGGAGNDTLIFDRADTATGGSGNDTFWVYFDGTSGSGAAEITDFAVGQDFLRISLNPDADHGDGTLTVAASENGQDAVVSINGQPVAMLRGAPGASVNDVYVEVAENVFA